MRWLRLALLPHWKKKANLLQERRYSLLPSPSVLKAATQKSVTYKLSSALGSIAGLAAVPVAAGLAGAPGAVGLGLGALLLVLPVLVKQVNVPVRLKLPKKNVEAPPCGVQQSACWIFYPLRG